jgi:hypothetical protein
VKFENTSEAVVSGGESRDNPAIAR